MGKMIILISGKAESGKDTVANIILDKQAKFGNAHNWHFANPVKFIATHSFGWDGKKDEAGRALLQMIGDGGRNYNPNIWVNEMLRSLRSTCNHSLKSATDGVLIVIPDTRYKNEIEQVLKFGEDNNVPVVTIRVERPNHENRLTSKQRANSSETDLDDWKLWDFKIINDSTKEALENAVLNVLEVMRIAK